MMSNALPSRHHFAGPIARHRYPRSRRHASRAHDALTEEQFDSLLGAVNAHTATGKRNLALLLVMADVGVRVSEATGLQTTDVIVRSDQPTHVDIRRGKGGRPGRVALTRRAADAVGSWLVARQALGLGHGPLLCTISSGTAGGHRARDGQTLEPGRPISTEYVRQLVHRLARRAGIPTRVTPHTLRHTFATRLLRVTGNVELTRKALRHANIQTTIETYARLG